MKRKLLLALIALTCALCLIFALAGCNPAENQSGTQQGGNSDDEKPDTHNYIFKCSQTEHWQVCTDCGEETAHTPHSVSDGVCPACGYVEKCTEGLKFTEIEENDEIIGYGVKKDTAWIDDSHVFIPSFYNNLPVISIYSTTRPFYGYGLKEITIGNNVTYIGEYAFEACTNLTKITIPDSVTSIGNGAFKDCTSLTEITIPDGVTSIGDGAFDDCRSLKEITIPDSVTSIGRWAFAGCESLKETTIPQSVTSIGDYAFRGCTSLTEITIPASVTSIGYQAFAFCTSLTEITIPASVTSIGYLAFWYCESLKGVYINDLAAWCNIDFEDNPLLYAHNLYLKGQLVTNLGIPNGVTAIKDGAFAGCESLKETTIPQSVTSIGDGAFAGCTSLENITVDKENKVYRSEDNCLIETKTQTVIVGCKTSKIPESVTYIGSFAFQGCTSLEEITIPDSITSIGDYAFAYCESLKETTIPDSVTSIGSDAFACCTSLESITVDKENKVYRSEGNCLIEIDTKTVILGCKNSKIPEGVTSIGEGAFYGCTSLEEITIPDSVIFIGSGAFSGCTNIKAATMPTLAIGYIPKDNLQTVILTSGDSIGDDAFQGCTSLEEITIPDSVIFIGRSAFAGCTSLTEITIGNSVTSISSDAFYDTAYYNDDINWKNDVLYIGNYLIAAKETLSGSYPITPDTKLIAEGAFYGCTSLEEITIPESVTSIGRRAFSECTSLTEITIPDSVTSIGSGAFSGCTNIKAATMPTLAIGYIPKDNLQTVILTSGDSIGYGAFEGCESLKEITIPDSVTSIGSDAFAYCTSLERVIFENTDGWKVSENSDMSNPEEINVDNPEKNANNLKGRYTWYYWKRGE